MDADSVRLNGASREIIGGAFTVLNALGPGFLEKVYENALAFELRDAGYKVVQQAGAAYAIMIGGASSPRLGMTRAASQ